MMLIETDIPVEEIPVVVVEEVEVVVKADNILGNAATIVDKWVISLECAGRPAEDLRDKDLRRLPQMMMNSLM